MEEHVGCGGDFEVIEWWESHQGMGLKLKGWKDDGSCLQLFCKFYRNFKGIWNWNLDFTNYGNLHSAVWKV